MSNMSISYFMIVLWLWLHLPKQPLSKLGSVDLKFATEMVSDLTPIILGIRLIKT